MSTLGTLLRILFGFIVACLVAGLVTAAFVITPSDISNLSPELRSERLDSALNLGLLAATHSAIFAFPFAFIAIAYAEWRSARSWLYYAVAGIVIGLLGFGAEYLSEQGVAQPSIANDYAARAFLSVGFLGGLAYWLVSGRLAGSARLVRADSPPATVQKSTPAYLTDDDADIANKSTSKPATKTDPASKDTKTQHTKAQDLKPQDVKAKDPNAKDQTTKDQTAKDAKGKVDPKLATGRR